MVIAIFSNFPTTIVIFSTIETYHTPVHDFTPVRKYNHILTSEYNMDALIKTSPSKQQQCNENESFILFVYISLSFSHPTFHQVCGVIAI